MPFVRHHWTCSAYTKPFPLIHQFSRASFGDSKQHPLRRALVVLAQVNQGKRGKLIKKYLSRLPGITPERQQGSSPSSQSYPTSRYGLGTHHYQVSLTRPCTSLRTLDDRRATAEPQTTGQQTRVWQRPLRPTLPGSRLTETEDAEDWMELAGSRRRQTSRNFEPHS